MVSSGFSVKVKWRKVNELNLWVCCWASTRDDNEKSEYVKILLLLRPLKDDRWGSFVGMNVLLTNADPLLLVLVPTYVEFNLVQSTITRVFCSPTLGRKRLK